MSSTDGQRGPAPYETAPVLENRPAPLTALLGDVTPTAQHYRRNHYPYPRVNAETWRLPVSGAVGRTVEFSLADLRALPSYSRSALLECAGHRRTEFSPPISGVQWGLGALSQAVWGGVRLADVLVAADIATDALEVVMYGADSGGFGELPGTHFYGRSIPLSKALHPDTLIALDMNGEPLPREHGAPARTLVPGWYAMDSVKWLTGIEVVTAPFRGPYQELDYRFQPEGETGIGSRIADMPVHSLVVSVADGDTLPAGLTEVAGIAWGGSGIESVEVRAGADPWRRAKIVMPGTPYERVVWSVSVDLSRGQTDLAVRATDTSGQTQPETPVWNRRGYVNNSVQRVAIVVS